MFCLTQNQTTAAYLSLYFFIFLILQFSNIEMLPTGVCELCSLLAIFSNEEIHMKMSLAVRKPTFLFSTWSDTNCTATEDG